MKAKEELKQQKSRNPDFTLKENKNQSESINLKKQVLNDRISSLRQRIDLLGSNKSQSSLHSNSPYESLKQST
eukprot:CAMPEP_0170548764 /NCGR_PEP_ID=MMETSP0211-20121228/6965_1 /TAXON_ID=311385 /ORGANISM="Pseudokeronopsis sp., Strain OXSARD2" /LENGTH=72 /DNA_ID=CAMNT_0010854397 /DNA_START=2647 /DNA_END=2865 /DNA_ORIENTATION=+